MGWGRTCLPVGRELCMTLHTGLAKHSLYCVKQPEFRTRKESHFLNGNKTKQTKQKKNPSKPLDNSFGIRVSDIFWSHRSHNTKLMNIKKNTPEELKESSGKDNKHSFLVGEFSLLCRKGWLGWKPCWFSKNMSDFCQRATSGLPFRCLYPRFL